MMQSSHSTRSSSHSTSGGGVTHGRNASSSSSADKPPDQKILTDLATLTDQINLCQSMLLAQQQASSFGSYSDDGCNNDEALLTVIGFLEACVPRMIELIEAAAQGTILKPETFEECLIVNDKLTTILSDLDKDPKDRKQRQQPITVPSVAAASAATTDAFAITNDDDDDDEEEVVQGIEKLGVGDSAAVPVSTAVSGGKTTGLDDENDDDDSKDPFAGGPDLLLPTPIASDPFSAGAATKSADDDDDFDAFFRDRTSAASTAGGGGEKQH